MVIVRTEAQIQKHNRRKKYCIGCSAATSTTPTQGLSEHQDTNARYSHFASVIRETPELVDSVLTETIFAF